MRQEIICNQREDLYQKVANRCATLLTRGIEKQGVASFIVPGGSTPSPIFEKLSRMSLLWNNVFITPSDERWVNIQHPQSNQRLIESCLMINHAKSSQIVGLKNDSSTPFEGEELSEKNISRIKKPFDVALLGMGEDGHFASLFPGSEQLERALDISSQKNCIGIDAHHSPVAGEFNQRMSLTLSALLKSKLIILIITGNKKLDVVRSAINENDSFDKPVAALLNQNKVPVEIYWAD